MIMTGLASNLPEFNFDPGKPFSGCRLCGKVFQTELDRSGKDPIEATANRKAWSHAHASKHSEKLHAQLVASGMWCTPQAAQKLAAYGVIDVMGLVMDNELIDAYKNAHVIPVEDCEGS